MNDVPCHVDPDDDRSEFGRDEAELHFERYLRSHGYEYEPDLGVLTRPDFVAKRGGVRLVCEVESFKTPPTFQQCLEGSTQAIIGSANEVYRPMRSAVKRAARQLKPLADKEVPLLVVLSNPLGLLLHLDRERLIEAMFGNPGWAGRFEAEERRVDNLAFEYGRDGRLRTNHPYISAVAVVREIDLETQYQQGWREAWKKDRSSLDYRDPGFTDAAVAEIKAENAAWKEHAAAAPSGLAYALDVLTTGSCSAVPLPSNVFDCARDTRIDVVRDLEAGHQ